MIWLEGMKVVIFAFVLLGAGGCARASETLVREQAAVAFSCADYALEVEEVGPEEYRASGCGRELIYACHRPVRRASAAASAPASAGEPQEEAGFGNAGEEAMECSRRPQ